MKIFAFTDLHINRIPIQHLVLRIQKAQPDVLICCGDFTIFGKGVHTVIRPLNDLGIPLLLIHGNHESLEEITTIAQKYTHVINLHERIVHLHGVTFFGHGGGGFVQTDPVFLKLATRLQKQFQPHQFIFVCHMPVYNTSLDYLPWMSAHRGNKSYRAFIEKYLPRLVLCGHFHEGEGKQDIIMGTPLLNPGPAGKIIKIEIKNKIKTT